MNIGAPSKDDRQARVRKVIDDFVNEAPQDVLPPPLDKDVTLMPDYHPITSPFVRPSSLEDAAPPFATSPINLDDDAPVHIPAAAQSVPTATPAPSPGPRYPTVSRPPQQVNKPSLFVTTPTIGGLKANYFISAVKLMNEFNKRQQHLSFMPHEGNSLIQAARNVCIREFMKHGASHCLLVDDDIGFEPESVMKMIESGYDFCAGAVPLRRLNFEAINHVVKNCGVRDNLERFGVRYNVNIQESGSKPGEIDIRTDDGSMKVSFAGTAFLVVTRKAIQKMIDECHGLNWYYDVQGNNDKTWDLFQPLIDDKHELNGEDVSFCKRWKSIGGEIRCWPDMKFSHHGPITLEGNFMTALIPQDKK